MASPEGSGVPSHHKLDDLSSATSRTSMETPIHDHDDNADDDDDDSINLLDATSKMPETTKTTTTSATTRTTGRRRPYSSSYSSMSASSPSLSMSRRGLTRPSSRRSTSLHMSMSHLGNSNSSSNNGNNGSSSSSPRRSMKPLNRPSSLRRLGSSTSSGLGVTSRTQSSDESGNRRRPKQQTSRRRRPMGDVGENDEYDNDDSNNNDDGDNDDTTTPQQARPSNLELKLQQAQERIARFRQREQDWKQERKKLEKKLERALCTIDDMEKQAKQDQQQTPSSPSSSPSNNPPTISPAADISGETVNTESLTVIVNLKDELEAAKEVMEQQRVQLQHLLKQQSREEDAIRAASNEENNNSSSPSLEDQYRSLQRRWIQLQLDRAYGEFQLRDRITNDALKFHRRLMHWKGQSTTLQGKVIQQDSQLAEQHQQLELLRQESAG